MIAAKNLTLALGIAALLAAPSLAQGPGGQGQGGRSRFGMGMPGGMVSMLMAPPVQEELSLSDEQIEQIEPIGEQFRADMMSRMQEMREQAADLSPEERREKFEAMSREMNAAVLDQIKEVLKPDQLERLEQIHLQQQGVQAFAEPKVREALALTEDQASEIEDVLASYRDQMRTILEAGRDAEDRGAVVRQMMDLRRSSMEKAAGLLTDEQRGSWDGLIGKPFQLGPGGFGPGGFGGRPGGRPPQN